MRILATFLILLSLVTTAAAGPTRPAEGPVAAQDFIVGSWTMTVLAYPDDGRRVDFENANLAGVYYTSNGQPKPIANAVYRDGNLYFTIPDLQLYFELRWTGNHFDGKMTAYSTSEKKAPEPVRMTKR
jgi:hypothetical protein